MSRHKSVLWRETQKPLNRIFMNCGWAKAFAGDRKLSKQADDDGLARLVCSKPGVSQFTAFFFAAALESFVIWQTEFSQTNKIQVQTELRMSQRVCKQKIPERSENLFSVIVNEGGLGGRAEWLLCGWKIVVKFTLKCVGNGRKFWIDFIERSNLG